MKKRSNKDYWRKRQDARLAYSERVANRTIGNIAEVYDDSLHRVQERIDNILENYSKNVSIPKDHLKKILSDHDRNRLIKGVEDKLKDHRLNDRNMNWIRENYVHRLNEQEAIKLELESERRIIDEYERKISTLGYSKTIDETYKSLVKDLTGKQGVLSNSAKSMMLNEPWTQGSNYSERIWKNTGKLSNDVDRIVTSGLLSGRSRIDMQNEIAERYEVAKYRAETLVRTEMNYFENASELQSYIDDGVTEYEYFATRDKKTSHECSTLDGLTFKVSEAVAGVNYPPMHPNCRSGTLPVIESMIMNEAKSKQVPSENDILELDRKQRIDSISKRADYVSIMQKDFGFTEIKSNGLEVDSMKEMAHSVNEFMNEFPEMNGKIYSCISKPSKKGWLAQATLKFSEPGILPKIGLNVNSNFFKNTKVYNELVTERVRPGWNTKQTGIRGTMRHEMGHIMEYQSAIDHVSNGADLTIHEGKLKLHSYIKNSTYAKEIVYDAYDNLGKQFSFKSVINDVSEYGATNFSEIIAESWANEDVTKEIPQEIVRLMRERWSNK